MRSVRILRWISIEKILGLQFDPADDFVVAREDEQDDEQGNRELDERHAGATMCGAVRICLLLVYDVAGLFELPYFLLRQREVAFVLRPKAL